MGNGFEFRQGRCGAERKGEASRLNDCFPVFHFSYSLLLLLKIPSNSKIADKSASSSITLVLSFTLNFSMARNFNEEMAMLIIIKNLTGEDLI
ncbi:MAG: hypothetical protein GWO08_02910 [Gammaproteobacteria bacterium]|nr:hypothetical protein [Gammaproteobacteria bacterium]NIS45868.1 hypothetical protein [candidate division Zixibacteria bacterium]NIU14005.1 hypothetical protein [candidate division Zixibacteria bacterium]NIV06040.1 hypothetical protein [candidate division Zixibacteria bacterium]NIW44840.1 hypothetical protein [Gammaproteobacteria bacterium]